MLEIMKDRIEEFIHSHRDEFDVHDPPEHVWQSVQKKLQPRKVHYHSSALALAASILLIVGSFAWFNKAVPAKVQPVTEVTVNPEIREAESYYAGLVSKQIKELEQYKSAYPDLYSDFQTELNSLNTYYAALKVEYANSTDKEVVKQSIIENLQTQADFTCRQLQIIRDIKNKESNRTSS